MVSWVEGVGLLWCVDGVEGRGNNGGRGEDGFSSLESLTMISVMRVY